MIFNLQAHSLSRSEIIALYEDIMLGNEEYNYESDHSYGDDEENSNQDISAANGNHEEISRSPPITSIPIAPSIQKLKTSGSNDILESVKIDSASQHNYYHKETKQEVANIQDNESKINRVSEIIFISKEKALELLQVKFTSLLNCCYVHNLYFINCLYCGCFSYQIGMKLLRLLFILMKIPSEALEMYTTQAFEIYLLLRKMT